MKHALTFFFILFLSLGATAEADVSFVQKVVSGNLFQTIDGEEVRLIGVDIPELKPEILVDSQARISNNPQQALEYVRSLISGGNVEIRVDARERDDDGRMLAYVWFLYPKDNYMSALEFKDEHEVSHIVDHRDYGHIVFLNAALIKAGYAAPKKDEFNNSFAALFSSIYHERNIRAVLMEQDLKTVELQAFNK